MALTVTTDRQAFRQAIVGWLNTYAGLSGRVIFENQAVPRPAKPYGTVQFPTGSIKHGFDEERASYDGISELIERVTTGPRTISVQVEVYTDPASAAHQAEAAELLENALLALDTVAVRDSFRAAKIGLLDVGAVMRMDEQLGDRWERRALAEITLSYSGETFDDGGAGTGDTIETVVVPTEANGNADYDSLED